MRNCFLFEKLYLHYAQCDFDSIMLHYAKLFIHHSKDREQIFDVTFEKPPIEKSCVRHWLWATLKELPAERELASATVTLLCKRNPNQIKSLQLFI